MQRFILTVSTLFLLIFSGTALANEAFSSTPSGLEYKDLKVGSGREAQLGDRATIHFVGWVADGGERGREIYNSRKNREPVSFEIGTEKVMEGWNEGVLGMRQGGTRMLRIPPHLGYGAKSVDDVVPPFSQLIFIIELLELD